MEGTAGFLGRAYDPYTLYPPGDDMDMAKMDRIKTDDLQLRPEVNEARLTRRATLRETVANGMSDLEKATAKYELKEYYGKALGLVLSGKAREAFELNREPAAVPEMGWFVICKDPQGNEFGLWQNDPSAPAPTG